MCYHDNTENVYSIGLLTPRPNNPRNTRQVDIPLENRLSVLLSFIILYFRDNWYKNANTIPYTTL
jgi:hypothetical protein